jgi:protein-S-isoprenylcysteine O-methyltransferase Ste14
MPNRSVFIYGVVSYLIFLPTFLYAFGFVTGIGVPTTLDGVARVPLTQALLINFGLLSLFAIQHSVMARAWFKDWLTQHIPMLAERPTYVLMSSLALIVLFAWWEPIGGTLWQLENPVFAGILFGIGIAGWATVLVTTFLINHFDLFGLRHAWLALKGQVYTPIRFRTPGLYKLVRHPLYAGWLMAFWATPHMGVSHLLFAALVTAYILVAIRFEERDLMRDHGHSYRLYRKQVGMLIPRLGRGAAEDDPRAV